MSTHSDPAPAPETGFPTKLLVALTFAGFGIVLLLFQDYGATVDEWLHAEYGRRVCDYYASGLRDARFLEFQNLRYYGAFFDLITEIVRRVSPLPEYDTRHLVNGLFGILGVTGVFCLAFRLAGTTAGVLAFLLLIACPTYFGHMFANPKDIPLAVTYVWALERLVVLWKAQDRVTTGQRIGFGLLVGAAMSVRVSGALLLIHLFVAGAIDTLTSMRVDRAALFSRVRSWMVTALVVVPTVWAVMWIFWPFIQDGPISRPLEAFDYMKRFPHKAEIPFAGETYWTFALPKSYMPHMLAVTLPLATLCGLLVAFVLPWIPPPRGSENRQTHRGPLALVVWSAIFPIAYASLSGATLYGGIRHFLFVVPPLSALAAVGITRLANRFSARGDRTALVLTVLLLSPSGRLLYALHPYQYTGYNELAGGMAAASTRYELDFWDASYREAIRRLASRIERERRDGFYKGPYGVVIIAAPWLSDLYFPETLRRTDRVSEADFFIATTNCGNHDGLNGSIIDKIERLGAVYAVIKDRRSETRGAGSRNRE